MVDNPTALSPEYLSDERLQRRALKIIHSDLSYSEALKVSGLQRLHERRESITTKLYHEVTNNPCHKYTVCSQKEIAVNIPSETDELLWCQDARQIVAKTVSF